MLRAALAVVRGRRAAADRPPGRDVAFTIAVIALGAKLAKADGVVSPEEEAAFAEIFRAAPEDAAAAAAVFGRAGETTLGFEGYARQLATRWKDEPALLEDVLDGLFHVAAADGRFARGEIEYLARVAEIFGLGREQFQALAARWAGADPEDPYLVLGVARDASDAEVRAAFRRLAAVHHPDRVAGRGLPHELEAMASARMAAINAAYDRLRAARGRKAPISD